MRLRITPRYYFHLFRDGIRYEDDDGQVLENADKAREIAEIMARDMMNEDFDPSSTWLQAYFEVADASGQRLFEVPFSSAVQFSHQHS